MPRIIAAAVMSTGRSRVNPAATAASAAEYPLAILSSAKVTTRMLFAVARPMHISPPIRAGTLIYVWVRYSPQHTPDNANGTASSTITGLSQLWNLITISRNTSTTASAMPPIKPS